MICDRCRCEEYKSLTAMSFMGWFMALGICKEHIVKLCESCVGQIGQFGTQPLTIKPNLRP